MDPNTLGHILNDTFAAAFGYIVCSLYCCDYTYKHRQYVIERLHFERENNFDRDNFDIEAAVLIES